jgi:predicted DNA-binding transcriptional regulator AlpA
MLITEKQAAEFLGIEENTLRVERWRASKVTKGKGGAENISRFRAMEIPPYIRLGRRIRYDEDDLRAYVDRHKIRPEAVGASR